MFWFREQRRKETVQILCCTHKGSSAANRAHVIYEEICRKVYGEDWEKNTALMVWGICLACKATYMYIRSRQRDVLVRPRKMAIQATFSWIKHFSNAVALHSLRVCGITQFWLDAPP